MKYILIKEKKSAGMSILSLRMKEGYFFKI